MSSGILGQAAPGAASEVDLYTCPANTLATLKVIISNRSALTQFTILVAVSGIASEVKQQLASAQEVLANDSVSTISFMIGAGDVVRVQSVSGLCSFSATGDERADK